MDKLLSLIILSCLITGCATNKEGIEHKGVVTKKNHTTPEIPSWVLNAEHSHLYPTGVSCAEIRGKGYQDKLNAIEVAKNGARLNLFKKLGGKQEISAVEGMEIKGSKAQYSAIITHKSAGEIGKNRTLNEGIYRLNGVNNYCVEIALI
ncbi:hypothetical protein [Parashewanella tropica]|uniref:hypothetical protein n=1 Tax=Parashewanella tropica TaxID=2547970 RepID=UPI00105A58EB|nr:hypothetical protein [Parashewanella tropica]